MTFSQISKRLLSGSAIAPPLAVVMLGRLSLLCLILFLLTGFTEYKLELAEISLFMAATFLVSLAYTLSLRKTANVPGSTLYQFTVDVFIVTGLVHFTGGINSTFTLLYPLVILAAGIVVSGNLAVKVAILSILLYATLITLEATEAMPYRGSGASPYDHRAQVAQLTMMQILLFALFATASNYLSDRYFNQARQLQRLRNIAKSTLSSVTTPLLAVKGAENLIKLANPSACRVLQRSEAELEGSPFTDLFKERPPTDAKTPEQIWWMKKGDGSIFPASLEISEGTLPAVILNTLHDDPDEGQLNLVAFHDIAELANREKTILDSEKTFAAAGMINEMAHVVRNPLTAIRGAGELINAAVEAALSHQHQINEKDFTTLKSMCEVIFEETQNLNSRVESFMQYATLDQKELLELITKTNRWREQVFNGEQSADEI